MQAEPIYLTLSRAIDNVPAGWWGRYRSPWRSTRGTECPGDRVWRRRTRVCGWTRCLGVPLPRGRRRLVGGGGGYGGGVSCGSGTPLGHPLHHFRPGRRARVRGRWTQRRSRVAGRRASGDAAVERETVGRHPLAGGYRGSVERFGPAPTTLPRWWGRGGGRTGVRDGSR